MKTYASTQIIQAEPMTDRYFMDKFKGIENLNTSNPGYRVVFPDEPAAWFPKKLFEVTYREISFREKEEKERLQAAKRAEE